MPRARAVLGCLALGGGLLLCPSAGLAQTGTLILTGGAGAGAVGSSPPTRTFNLSAPQGPLTIPETTVQAAGASSSGITTIAGSAQYGQVSGRISAAATAAGTFDLGAGSGSVNAGWVDILTVTGPPGLDVTFRIRMVVSGTATAGPARADCLNVAAVSAQVNITTASLNFRRGAPGPPCSSTVGEANQSATFTTRVGALLPLISTLTVSAAVQAFHFVPPPTPAASAAAEGAVLSVQLEVLTPGASYTTASGTRYDGPPAPPVIARVESVSGTVLLKTPLDSQSLAAGGGVAPGSLIQTGGNGTATLTLDSGIRFTVDPDTQVTLLPPVNLAVPETRLNQVKGFLRHTRPVGAPGAESYSVRTATASVRPTGTEFSTRYTEANRLGSTVVNVQQGMVDVTNRLGQHTTLLAGAQASFDDPTPRVTLILPVAAGFLVPNKTNTFAWTSFAGAGGYVVEYTLNPAGFAQANPTSAAAPANTLRLTTGSFTDSGGTVEFSLPPSMTSGLPAGLKIHWRVFATNAAGVTLAATTASDASSLTVLGARVSPVFPADNAPLAGGTVGTFTWTSFTGATGYLFEYTLNTAGFAQPNAAQVESVARAIRLNPGAFVNLAGSIRLSVQVPPGIAAAGTRARWRVFPIDAAGLILPFATASDARAVVLQ